MSQVTKSVIYKCQKLLILLYKNVTSYQVCYIQMSQVTKSFIVQMSKFTRSVIYKCHKLLSLLYIHATSYSFIYKCHNLLSLLYINVTGY
jgi:hypothetical protein